MKKILLALFASSLLLFASACGSSSKEGTITIGATAVPHAEILNFIKPILKEQGVDLVVKEFSDYAIINSQLFEKNLDADFFQHKPYLDAQNREKKMDLVSVANVHIEPFGAYSKKINDLKDLKDGSTVAIPNDPTNGGRALLLLEKQGLIKLKSDAGIEATPNDIVQNDKKLVIKELDAGMLPRSLDDVELALINTNYAMQAGLNPLTDSLFIEDKDSPYANILAARPDNKDSEAIQKVVTALNSPEVKKFIEDNYHGSILPAF
ncbi:ABC transporter substrate-binding protein [Paenibacillus albiflavus]|uniref:ABC transporter substrate-binding protein n=1 Tax=Paenibacillus albiflavus TaxID=2545760 RepID=A0A4R4EL20_9BACL|nr:MetQ/NlpA family ABC transporter substrate-binding protein [Paenibacillus albiflavus]TCZ80936.1 ABC transporter substrate-binding protein [Paenibacillus albiflavus]